MSLRRGGGTRHNDAGLGDQFLVSLEATIDRASKWPNAGTPVIRGDQDEIVERKVATHGFPYAVRYRVIDGRLVIMAVYHQHRDPGFGNERRARADQNRPHMPRRVSDSARWLAPSTFRWRARLCRTGSDDDGAVETDPFRTYDELLVEVDKSAPGECPPAGLCWGWTDVLTTAMRWRGRRRC